MAKQKLTAAERFQVMLKKAEQRDSFHVDAAKLELSEQIFVAMEEKGVSEAELSRRLEVSRAYVNKILQGSANLTIESLVKIGRALESEFKFGFGRLEPEALEDVLDTEYIYEAADKVEIFYEPHFNWYRNVTDINQFKLNVSKNISSITITEKRNALSEFAA